MLGHVLADRVRLEGPGHLGQGDGVEQHDRLPVSTGGDALDGGLEEVHVAAAYPGHGAGQVDHDRGGQGVVHGHRLGHRLNEPSQLHGIRERPAVDRGLEDGAHPVLLALNTAEVPVRQGVALPGVDKGLLAGEPVGPGGQDVVRVRGVLPAGEVQGLGQGDIDPAQLVGQGLEGLKIRNGEMVNMDPGDVLHRPDQQRGASPGVGGVDLGPRVVVHDVVGRDRHPGVARDGHNVDPLPVPADLHDHNRVGALGTHLPLGGVLGVDPGVRAQDQEGDGLAGRAGGVGRAAPQAREGVAQVLDAAQEAADEQDQPDPGPRNEHQEHQQHRGRLVPDHPGAAPVVVVPGRDLLALGRGALEQGGGVLQAVHEQLVGGVVQGHLGGSPGPPIGSARVTIGGRPVGGGGTAVWALAGGAVVRRTDVRGTIGG